MSRVIPPFDPTAATSGIFNTQLGNSGGKMVAVNESPVSVQFTFADGSTELLPAFTAWLFEWDIPTPVVSWAQASILANTGGFINLVQCVIYSPAENVPGTFPVALARLVNVGGTVKVANSAVIADALSVEVTTNTTTTIVSATTPANGNGNYLRISGYIKVGAAGGAHQPAFSIAYVDNGGTNQSAFMQATEGGTNTIVRLDGTQSITGPALLYVFDVTIRTQGASFVGVAYTMGGGVGPFADFISAAIELLA